MGIRVLHAEARHRFAVAGAKVGEATQIFRIDRALAVQALASSPSEFTLHGATPEKDVPLGGDSVVFCPVIGPPCVCDLDCPRCTGTRRDTQKFVRPSEHFDVIHVQAANVEPQGVPSQRRHLNRAGFAGG